MIFRHSIFILATFLLVSCATNKKEIEKNAAIPKEVTESEDLEMGSSKVPPKMTKKDGRELALVRIMDGGACNSEDRGVRGLFLVYADPQDVERIKSQKGAEIFQGFEHDIESLSLQALQESIDVINFDDNPFALDLEDALKQEVQQLILKFKEFAEPAIDNFKLENGVTIDVIPFAPSIGFILENCNSALRELPEDIE